MNTPDPVHFVRALAAFGERHPVRARQAVYSASGVKLLDAGATIVEALIERLSAHRLREPLEHCVGCDVAVDATALRDGAAAIIGREPFYARLSGSPAERARLLGTIARIALPEPIALQLAMAREIRNEVWLHSLRAALVAAWLARVPGAPDSDVTQHAAAGLLHDLGMLHVDPALLQPGQKVDRAQRRQLWVHAVISARLVERHPVYPRELVRAVLEHHELLDGSGYPRALAGDAISPAGRVLAMAEQVTAIVVPRRPQAELRLAVALKMNRRRYDATLAQRVIEKLEPLADLDLEPATPDPAATLAAIDAVLAAWPVEGAHAAGLPERRAQALATIQSQCQDLQRTLAGAGAAPAELAQLGTEALADRAIVHELGLIAREAGWQLRAVSRLARRLWKAGADEPWPPPLAGWLARVEALCEPLLGS